MSNLSISIRNNNSSKTGLTVTDLDIRNRLIGSSKSVTSWTSKRSGNVTDRDRKSLPDFKSQSVTHRTNFPLLLLQIETNGEAGWQTSRSVTSGTQFFCLPLQIETNLGHQRWQTRLSTLPGLPSPAVGGCCGAVRRIAAALGTCRP